MAVDRHDCTSRCSTGGAVMLWLAITTYDGLVSDDYYKEGLAINSGIAPRRAGCRTWVPRARQFE
jgi:hypothetical protein